MKNDTKWDTSIDSSCRASDPLFAICYYRRLLIAKSPTMEKGPMKTTLIAKLPVNSASTTHHHKRWVISTTLSPVKQDRGRTVNGSLCVTNKLVLDCSCRPRTRLFPVVHFFTAQNNWIGPIIRTIYQNE